MSGAVERKSGFLIIFEEEPETDHFNGIPRNYPANLTPLQLSRLIREGFDEYRLTWEGADTVAECDSFVDGKLQARAVERESPGADRESKNRPSGPFS